MAIAQAISSAAFGKRLPASSLGVWQILESDFRGRNDRDGVEYRRCAIAVEGQLSTFAFLKADGLLRAY